MSSAEPPPADRPRPRPRPSPTPPVTPPAVPAVPPAVPAVPPAAAAAPARPKHVGRAGRVARHPLTADIGLGVLIALLMLLLRRTLLTEQWIVSIVPSVLFGALYVLAVRLARVFPQRGEPGGRRALRLVVVEAAVVLVLFLVLAVVL